MRGRGARRRLMMPSSPRSSPPSSTYQRSPHSRNRRWRGAFWLTPDKVRAQRDQAGQLGAFLTARRARDVLDDVMGAMSPVDNATARPSSEHGVAADGVARPSSANDVDSLASASGLAEPTTGTSSPDSSSSSASSDPSSASSDTSSDTTTASAAPPPRRSDRARKKPETIYDEAEKPSSQSRGKRKRKRTKGKTRKRPGKQAKKNKSKAKKRKGGLRVFATPQGPEAARGLRSCLLEHNFNTSKY